ncbi:transglutaminase-like cysteine peptidase [Eoetvoesiella caeni]
MDELEGMGVRGFIGLALSCGCILLGGWLATPAYGSAAWAAQEEYAGIIATARAKYGSGGAQAVADWLAMLEATRPKTETAKLQAVNKFWNSQLHEASDSRIWGQDDYWATPLESLGMGLGDCEDFVIGKYFSLVQLGVEPEKLRFIYVRAATGANGAHSVAHMVLGYYASPQAEPLVLDNLMPRIVSASKRGDLTPVFSFNVKGIYVPGAKPASVDRIGRWQALLGRMREQGFHP